MKIYNGKTAYKGIAIGKIHELIKQEEKIRRKRIDSVDSELLRLTQAKETAIVQLGELYKKFVKEVGETNAAIFEIHQMMLEDDDYLNSIVNIIKTQNVNAEYAVATTSDNFAHIFAAMDDEYMKERAADVKDISGRLLTILSSGNDSNSILEEQCIIVADDLAPSETVQLDKEKVLAFVTRKGSVNSHTAILARTMNIPAIVDTALADDVDGKLGIVNGIDGELIIDPDEQTLLEFQKKKIKLDEKNKLLLDLKGRQAITKSGKKIKLYANIGGIGDVGAALQNDAEGIGLFRSEFLYLQEDNYPSEES